jgi:hypothetical protein
MMGFFFAGSIMMELGASSCIIIFGLTQTLIYLQDLMDYLNTELIRS